MPKRPPWGHVSRHCVYCGKVGPRTPALGGYAHKRCIPKPFKQRRPRKPWPAPRSMRNALEHHP